MAGHNACPIATQLPGQECMNDLTTERSLDLQAMWIIDVIDLSS